MNDLRALERKGLTDSGVKPMLLNDVARCDGLRYAFCRNCARKAAERLPNVSYWFISPELRTTANGVECPERRPILSRDQVDAMDETARLSHVQTLPHHPSSEPSHALGAGDIASTTVEGMASA